MKKLVFFVALFLATLVHAAHFLYPVDVIDDEHLLVMHQKSSNDIELLVWNAKHKFAMKELGSMFMPSDVKIVPGGEAFSFIDRGRIKIKPFARRAPRNVEIFEPIDSIFSITWLTDTQFYFSGRTYGSFRCFLCDIEEGLQPKVFALTDDSQVFDYLYPCKVGSDFYCVVRNIQHDYFIVKLCWEPLALDSNVNLKRPEKILFESMDPICSLCVGKKYGHFITCTSRSGDSVLNFSCFRFCLKKHSVDELFTFQLPARYVVEGSESQAYESIAPFLPKFQNDEVYFIDINDENNISAYRYRHGCATPLYSNALSPLFDKSKVYFGLILNNSVFDGIDQNERQLGSIVFDLPFAERYLI